VKLKGGFAPIIILIIVIFVVGTGITVGYPHIKGLVENKLQTDLSATPSGSPESEDLPNTSGPTDPPKPSSTAKPTSKPATPTPKTPSPTNNSCTVSTMTEPSSQNSVRLIASADSKNGSYISGAQWDFDGNGSWDTDMNISNSNIVHSYSDGSHLVKLQLKMSDGSTTEICSKSVNTPLGFSVSLTGTVYEDINCNNMREPSEKPLSGVRVQITNMDGYATLANLTSDSNGSYNFSYVLSGSNSISVKPHAYPLDNYGLTNSGDGHTVSLNSSQSHINMDLGQIPAPVGDYCSF